MSILMRLIIADAVIAIGCCVLFALVVIKADSILKKKHPGFTGKKMFWADRAHMFIEIIFSMMCPIWNLIVMYMLLFKYDEICSFTIKLVEKKYGLNELG